MFRSVFASIALLSTPVILMTRSKFWSHCSNCAEGKCLMRFYIFPYWVCEECLPRFGQESEAVCKPCPEHCSDCQQRGDGSGYPQCNGGRCDKGYNGGHKGNIGFPQHYDFQPQCQLECPHGAYRNATGDCAACPSGVDFIRHLSCPKGFTQDPSIPACCTNRCGEHCKPGCTDTGDCIECKPGYVGKDYKQAWPHCDTKLPVIPHCAPYGINREVTPYWKVVKVPFMCHACDDGYGGEGFWNASDPNTNHKVACQACPSGHSFVIKDGTDCQPTGFGMHTCEQLVDTKARSCPPDMEPDKSTGCCTGCCVPKNQTAAVQQAAVQHAAVQQVAVTV